MFKKIFISILCGILLWGLFTSAKGGMTRYSMPENKTETSINMENGYGLERRISG